MFDIEVVSYVYTGPQPGFFKYEESYEHYMLLAVETGAYDYAVGHQAGSAAFGDLVFTPPHTPFRRKALSDITFHLFGFVMRGQTGHIPVGKVTIRDVNRLASTYSYMRNCYKEPAGDPTRTGALTHMLRDLLHVCDIETRQAAKRKKAIDPLMQQAAGLVQRYLHNEINMQEIAARIGIKPSELTRRFRLAYGQTPIDYATGLRLDEVKRLLIETTDTLEAIAVRCGYDSGSYLSRIFRAKTGIPPSEFRRRHQF